PLTAELKSTASADRFDLLEEVVAALVADLVGHCDAICPTGAEDHHRFRRRAVGSDEFFRAGLNHLRAKIGVNRLCDRHLVAVAIVLESLADDRNRVVEFACSHARSSAVAS